MGRTHDRIDDRMAAWLQSQPVFFVATAPRADDGHVNCSPKGNRGEFVVAGHHQVMYLEQTGSGIETAAHLQENGRIVVMFCAFEGQPRIVRLHGRGRVLFAGTAQFSELQASFPGGDGVGVRSIVVIDVERISDSCGFGVPLMSFSGHRAALEEWAIRKGPEGVERYWAEKNGSSLDGLPGVRSPAV